MKKTLVDSGPLVALFDRSDQYHARTISFLKNFRGHLITSWPVLTEVSHLLDFSVQAQIDFYTWVDRGGVTIENLEEGDLAQMIELVSKYKDRPMDLADASLVLLAEKTETREILTYDQDFLIYRLSHKRTFINLLHQ